MEEANAAIFGEAPKTAEECEHVADMRFFADGYRRCVKCLESVTVVNCKLVLAKTKDAPKTAGIGTPQETTQLVVPMLPQTPWEAHLLLGRHDDEWGIYCTDITGSIVAQVGGFVYAPRSPEQAKTIALVLAAAPEVLEAAIDLETWLSAPQDDPMNRRQVEDRRAYLRQAIGKATGNIVSLRRKPLASCTATENTPQIDPQK